MPERQEVLADSISYKEKEFKDMNLKVRLAVMNFLEFAEIGRAHV